jgi:hypothetical protein
MTAFLFGVLGLAVIALSFGFATLVLAMTRRGAERSDRTTVPPSESRHDTSGSTETINRLLADIEQLASLRDRGALTEKEFAAGKAKLLGQGGQDRNRRAVQPQTG